MVDEKKVRLMTRMASYEANEGKEDLKISSFYRNDYVSLQVVATIIWVTIGYAIVVLLAGACILDKLMKSFSISMVITLGVFVVAGYIGVLVVYGIATHVRFSFKHQKARARVKKYNHDLARLLKMYEKENQ